MLRALAALGLGAVVAPSCAAPTLPLPPPTALVSGPDPAGYVTVSGSARPNAYVFALNNRTEEGVIGVADSAGNYSLRLLAQRGDSLSVWYMVGSQTSAIRDVEIR